MSITSQIEAKTPISTPEPADNMASEFISIPSCTIEDVDKALFNLFNRDLPLLYTQRNDTRRVPIVFATGERFALIAKKQPLRDRSKALILPVISIMRSGLTLGSEIGMATAPDIRHVIKKQLSKEDATYQRIMNKLGLQNSDDLAATSAFADAQQQVGADPGRLATRRPGAGSQDTAKLGKGNLLTPSLGNNIYEMYEMPAPVYFTATYDITIWTQYVQEMNNILAAIATEGHFNAKPSYRIETDKGYYFVAYIDSNISPGNNFDDFSEEERIVRSTLTIKVPGYFLGNAYKGAPNRIRKYVSAPQVSFDVQFENDQSIASPGIPSADTNDYILQNFFTTDDAQPGQFIGEHAPVLNSADGTSTVGGHTSPAHLTRSHRIKKLISPFSAGGSSTSINVTEVTSTAQGEKTYREIV